MYLRYPLFAPIAAGLLLLSGCSSDASSEGREEVAVVAVDSVAPADSAAAVDTVAADIVALTSVEEEEEFSPPPTPTVNLPRKVAPDQIRGFYLNAYSAGSSSRLPRLLEIADETEINTFVVDVKDELGIRYRSQIPLAQELANAEEVRIRDLAALAETLDEHGIYSIARIVVFNDRILAEARPGWSIRKEDGSLWLDRSDHSWVSPWDPRVWNYNLLIAEEAARAGFDEIQFDYVRFPEQFQSLPPQVHPRADGDRTDAIVAFLKEARRRLHPLGVNIAADVFGLSPNTYNDVGIGQQWERISAMVDHILPMMYPSHYYSTHLPNVAEPHAMPYETLYKAAGMARLRRDRMEEAGLDPARIIVWLEAFQATWLRDDIEYGPEELRAQKRGVYDVGLDDWILWHPGSRFEPFLPALEEETVSRASTDYEPPEDVARQVRRIDELGGAAAREEARAALAE